MTEPQQSTAVALARIEGRIDTVLAKMDAGDRESAQRGELLKQRIEQVARQTEAADRRVDAEQLRSEGALSVVRVDLERQIRVARDDISRTIDEHMTAVLSRMDEITASLREHRVEDQPHSTTLGRRVGVVEHDLTASRTRTALIAGGLVLAIPVLTNIGLKVLGG